MRSGVLMLCLTVLSIGCSGVSEQPEPAEMKEAAPVTNADGEITGDPFAQCEITQSTAQPEPPFCVGNPRFEWERAPIYGDHEPKGWLTGGVLLSDRNASHVTVGFDLADDCGIVHMSVRETTESVTVGLQYGALDPHTDADCDSNERKWALQGHLEAPLGDRELLFFSDD